MSLAKKIKQEICIQMIYNITTFNNVFQSQTAKFNNAKPSLLLHQPNKLEVGEKVRTFIEA